MKWVFSLVNYYWCYECHECVNAFQRLLFLFSSFYSSLRIICMVILHALYIRRHYYQRLVLPSFFVFFLFFSPSFLCLELSSRLLHHVNWLALLLPSKNVFWHVSLDDNDDDDECSEKKHNYSRLMSTIQWNHNASIYTHIYIFNLIIVHFVFSLFYTCFFSLAT